MMKYRRLFPVGWFQVVLYKTYRNRLWQIALDRRNKTIPGAVGLELFQLSLADRHPILSPNPILLVLGRTANIEVEKTSITIPSHLAKFFPQISPRPGDIEAQ